MIFFKEHFFGRLRWALLLAIVAASGFVFWKFYSSRSILDQAIETGLAVIRKPGLSIGKVQHTATRNGITEWELEAGSAEYINEEKKAVLKDLSITYFLKNDETALLKADRAVLATDSYDIEITGNVVMKNQGYSLKTQALNYKHENRTIFTQTPVTVSGDSFSLTADRLKLDLAKNQTILEGHVKGILNEKPEM
jgi:LPS export ABC transporter protein LptC